MFNSFFSKLTGRKKKEKKAEQEKKMIDMIKNDSSYADNLSNSDSRREPSTPGSKSFIEDFDDLNQDMIKEALNTNIISVINRPQKVTFIEYIDSILRKISVFRVGC